MSIWQRFTNLLAVMMPAFWFRNYTQCSHLSREINRLLDDGVVPACDRYEVIIGHLRLWGANYPYAYAEDRDLKVMPNRRTVRRLSLAARAARYSQGRSK